MGGREEEARRGVKMLAGVSVREGVRPRVRPASNQGVLQEVLGQQTRHCVPTVNSEVRKPQPNPRGTYLWTLLPRRERMAQPKARANFAYACDDRYKKTLLHARTRRYTEAVFRVLSTSIYLLSTNQFSKLPCNSVAVCDYCNPVEDVSLLVFTSRR